MEERRESVRVSCRLEVESKTGDKWFILYSKNVGTDGMMLTCESNIEKLKNLGIDAEKNVFLSFYLPSNQNDLVKIAGRIVYLDRKVDPINDSEVSFIGIKFEDVSDHANKQLESFVSGQNKRLII